jgi:hypothetical protein
MIFRVTFLTLLLTLSVFSQSLPSNKTSKIENLELPELIEHLPDWENAKDRAKFVTNLIELKKIFPNEPIVDLIDFSGGTLTVSADYEQGRLLIVEFTTPQFAVQADEKFKQFLTQNQGNTHYKKVGNYSIFLFNKIDEQSAAAFVDRIDYGKTVQWLGEDPYYLAKVERYYAETLTGALVSSFLFIGIALAVTTLLGILAGFLMYYSRKNRREANGMFSDAGGMTRLNLDDLIK